MDRRSRDGESTLCVSRSWERRGRCRRRLILRASRAIRMRETTGEGENGIEAITRHINHLSTNDPLGSAHQVLLDSTREYRSSLSEDCCDQEVPELFEYQKRLLANVLRKSVAASGRSHASLCRSIVQPRLPRAELPTRGCDDASVCRFPARRKLESKGIHTASSNHDAKSMSFTRSCVHSDSRSPLPYMRLAHRRATPRMRERIERTSPTERTTGPFDRPTHRVDAPVVFPRAAHPALAFSHAGSSGISFSRASSPFTAPRSVAHTFASVSV